MADPHPQLAWHHVQCDIPPDWEVTAYAIEPRIGRMEFSTRRGLQSLYSWEPCKKAPDANAALRDFVDKLCPARNLPPPAEKDVTVRECGPWLLAGAAEGPARALWFQAKTQTLLSWVFEPSARGEAQQILQSSRPNDGDMREFRIHGLHARVPKDYEIEAMHVHAANVMIHFESNRRRRLVFRRWGMPHLVLDGRTPEIFYPWMLRAAGYLVGESRATTLRGMPAVRADFSMKPVFQLDKFMGKRWKNGEGLLWWNASEKRLYSFEQIGPAKVPALDLHDCNPELPRG